LREHQAAHLGKQDDQDCFRRRGKRRFATEALQQREQRANRYARITINRALEFDVHVDIESALNL